MIPNKCQVAMDLKVNKLDDSTTSEAGRVPAESSTL